ncbi:hypothetical protein [Devosia neptuniae]|jgi:hypothetical protein|uniref:hypothetical protein n=1 Tax=Devosia TaxID=46913 RepID=UPI0022B044CA|nr:hypothetical protein [Devosia neptuniae]MCZ4344512.1 hypothetical protein [Devosia neptuniae]|tara:strand:- start:7495 stop:7671 length:177 start_codon:yes stop_codon:yes gene_type:complete
MTHYKSDDAYAHPELTDIISPDEARPGLLRQFANGLGGLVVLMLTGLVLIVMVFWKSP